MFYNAITGLWDSCLMYRYRSEIPEKSEIINAQVKNAVKKMSKQKFEFA